MAIEGPLRELGIHDVFQLLDLSRKTGALRVTSDLRDDEGVVLFDGGRVIHASVRSHPTSIERILRQAGKVNDADMAVAGALDARAGEGLGDRLVRAGVLTQRELERQLRLAIESVVFELLSWQEGFFSFEERAVADVPLDARIRISTESLLMEGARRGQGAEPERRPDARGSRGRSRLRARPAAARVGSADDDRHLARPAGDR